MAFALCFVLCWFFSLSEVSLGWRWKCYRWLVVVAVASSSSEVHQVRASCVAGWVSWFVTMFFFSFIFKLTNYTKFTWLYIDNEKDTCPWNLGWLLTGLYTFCPLFAHCLTFVFFIKLFYKFEDRYMSTMIHASYLIN